MWKAVAIAATSLFCMAMANADAIKMGPELKSPGEQQRERMEHARNHLKQYIDMLKRSQSRNEPSLVAFGNGPSTTSCGDADVMIGFHDGWFYLPSAGSGANISVPADHSAAIQIKPTSGECVIHISMTVDRVK